MTDFLEQLARKAALVDRALHEYLHSGNDYPPVVHEAMRYSVFAGGKRLRPAFTLAAAEVAGVAEQEVLPAACAVELIHTYSLIHDDLPSMDNDDLRRGKPTNHRVFGEAVALLAGNALFALAFELLAGCARHERIEAPRVVQVMAEMAAACGTSGLIGGQVLDIISVTRDIGEEDLEYIHHAKTGALFRAAVRTGAILGGAAAPELEKLTEFASLFGLAFQITDDILDVVGEAEKIGKPVGSDVRNQKHTYVSFYGVAAARRRVEDVCAGALAALNGLGSDADFFRQAVQFIAARDF